MCDAEEAILRISPQRLAAQSICSTCQTGVEASAEAAGTLALFSHVALMCVQPPTPLSFNQKLDEGV